MARVILAHARSNEIGQVSGGKAGDQTGLEVCVQAFFEHQWNYILRPIKNAVKESIAKNAELAASNNNIGYDQPDRYSMYLLVKSLGYDFTKISKPCNTDCSQLVATLILAAGIKVSPYIYTGNMVSEIMKTKEFELIPYTDSKQLRRGDILVAVTARHTAVVVEGYSAIPQPSATVKYIAEVYGVEDGHHITVKTEPKASANMLKSWPYLSNGNMINVCDEVGDWVYIRIADTNYGYIPKVNILRHTAQRKGTVTTALHMRQNAGTRFKSLMVMPKGAVVEICDTKKAATGADWYYIVYKNIRGFASAKYIK